MPFHLYLIPTHLYLIPTHFTLLQLIFYLIPVLPYLILTLLYSRLHRSSPPDLPFTPFQSLCFVPVLPSSSLFRSSSSPLLPSSHCFPLVRIPRVCFTGVSYFCLPASYSFLSSCFFFFYLSFASSVSPLSYQCLSPLTLLFPHRFSFHSLPRLFIYIFLHFLFLRVSLVFLLTPGLLLIALSVGVLHDPLPRFYFYSFLSSLSFICPFFLYLHFSVSSSKRFQDSRGCY